VRRRLTKHRVLLSLLVAGLGTIGIVGSALATVPTLTVPADFSVEATSLNNTIVTFTVSSDLDPSPICTPASGSFFALGPTLVSCTATDPSSPSDQTTKTFTVTVQDTKPPTITVPSVPAVEATSSLGAVVSYTPPTATDAVDVTDPVTCTSAPTAGLSSGSTFPIGTTTVTCNATDNAGNPADPTPFTVTVQDTTPPDISPSSVPGPITVPATDSSGAVVTYTLPTATDPGNVSLPVTVTCTPDSGSTFPIGTTTVNCNASDSRSNTTPVPVTFTVTVSDEDSPVFSGVPGPGPVEATGPSGAAVTYVDPTANDLVDGPRPVACAPDSGSIFPLGTTTVTCTTSDLAGHTSTATFPITVQDTTAPAVNGLPDPITAEATGPAGAIVTYATPTATDAVDGTDPVTCTPGSGSIFALGANTVSCDTADLTGNTAAPATFTVTVQDTTPPRISARRPIKVEATGHSGAVVTYTLPTATDIVDGTDLVTCEPRPGSTFALGGTTVTCTTTDRAGNTATPTTFRVTVRDTKPPAFVSQPANITRKVKSKTARVRITYQDPTAKDKVDGAITSTCSPSSGHRFKLGRTTIVCKAVDSHGNRKRTSFQVRVMLFVPGLTFPANRAVLSSPPTLSWTAVKKARYYNLQLWQGSHKVLSVWPRTHQFRLKRSWKYLGTRYDLTPGKYSWYVWPGFGRMSEARYGKLLGTRTFLIH
jgi:hypothetical protein